MSRNTLASNEILAYVLILVIVKVNDAILNPKMENTDAYITKVLPSIIERRVIRYFNLSMETD
jgi:hypothetical protein